MTMSGQVIYSANTGYVGRAQAQLRGDGILFGTMLLLLAASILMVFSTTAVPSQELYGNSTAMIRRHLFSILIGLGGFFVFSSISPFVLKRFAVWAFLGSLFLLVLVLFLGKSAGGATRWLQLGPLRVQPGELMKLSAILFIAHFIDRFQHRIGDILHGVIMPFGVLCLVGVVLLLQPDFGSTVVILIVAFSQLMMVAHMGHIITIGVLGSGVLGMLVVSSPYRMRRFLAFLDPFNDPSSSGYQLIQSLVAVGSGGLWGAGLGVGKQKLFYLPAAHTDFIFAVIAEEFGFFGGLFILCLFLLILFRGLRIVQALQEDLFLSSLALGCTMLMVVPALLNMGVVLGLLPTKGLVLPLVAFGGTAMIVHLSAMGILMRLSKTEIGRS